MKSIQVKVTTNNSNSSHRQVTQIQHIQHNGPQYNVYGNMNQNVISNLQPQPQQPIAYSSNENDEKNLAIGSVIGALGIKNKKLFELFISYNY